MATITWRNVNTPNFGASNNLALAGAQNVQRGIEGVAAGLQDYGAKDKLETEGNIKSFIDSFRNQDDYLAARDSGAFSDEALTKAYGGNFDSRVAQQYAKDREGAINREEQAAYDQGQKGFLRQKDADSQAQYALDQTNNANMLAYQQDIAENMPKGLSVAAQNRWKTGRGSYNNLNRVQQENDQIKQRGLFDTDYNNRETDYQRSELAKQRNIAPVIGALNQSIIDSRGNAGELERILNNVQKNPNKHIQALAPEVAGRLDSLNNAKAARVELDTLLEERAAIDEAASEGSPTERVNVNSEASKTQFSKLNDLLIKYGEVDDGDIGDVVTDYRKNGYNGYDVPPGILMEALKVEEADRVWLSPFDIDNDKYTDRIASLMIPYIAGVKKNELNKSSLNAAKIKKATSRFSADK